MQTRIELAMGICSVNMINDVKAEDKITDSSKLQTKKKRKKCMQVKTGRHAR